MPRGTLRWVRRQYLRSRHLYGRFGAWFRDAIPQGGERTLRVRFLIIEGEMPGVELLTRLSNEFGGVQEAVAVLSVNPAESPAAALAAPGSGDQNPALAAITSDPASAGADVAPSGPKRLSGGPEKP